MTDDAALIAAAHALLRFGREDRLWVLRRHDGAGTQGAVRSLAGLGA